MTILQAIKRKYLVLKGDRILWAMIIILMLFSLLVVFSATGKLAYNRFGGDTTAPLLKQVKMFLMALVAMLFVQSWHYKYFISLAKLTCWGAILLLGLALLSTRINGAARWLEIPIVGLTIQPSEIAKLGLVMYMARVIAFEQRDGYCADTALTKIAIYVVPMWGLVFWENFSTSVLLALVCWALLFIGRLRRKTMLILVSSAACIATLFLVIILNTTALDDIARVTDIKERLNNADSFQADQTKIAIALGGLYGTGIGRSTQRDFLPYPVADDIYAVIVEEYGLLIGGIPVLAIYLIILYRVGVIVRRCTRMFPALLVAGLGLTMVLQALMHMLVCVGVFPVTGQPLPLVSMGGSSILFTGVAIGMIQSVAHTVSEAGKREEQERQKRRGTVQSYEVE
ncbi:MAG: FtsW/RodA/SpoVE family cell cycle protein [Odoribacteraceae bacterium]|jgi:cell division protein FtsW|nr:FtsW/RodA/SpoVE family cell cycle protein [Odoribacteraceae bacterium]